MVVKGILCQYFGHLMWRTDLLEKTLMLGKIETGGERDGTTEDKMVGWHHRLDGHEFEQVLGWWCCSPWVAESGTTEWLNWTELSSGRGAGEGWIESLGLADACALQKEKPLQREALGTATKSSSCSPQLEKAHMQQRRPSATTTKNNNSNK